MQHFLKSSSMIASRSPSVSRFTYQRIQPITAILSVTLHSPTTREYQSKRILTRSFHSPSSSSSFRLSAFTTSTSPATPPRHLQQKKGTAIAGRDSTDVVFTIPSHAEPHASLRSVPSLSGALTKLDALHRQDDAYARTHPIAVKGKFQQLWHDYGYVGVGTYLSVYVGTLGMLYIAISSGAIGGETVMKLVEKLGMSDHFSADISPKSGSFLMAWVATKLTEPVRLAVSVAITPKVARWLGRVPPKKVDTKALKQAEAQAEAVKKQ